MTEHDRIAAMLTDTPILLADAEADEVRLIGEGEATDRMLNSDRPVLLTHLGRALPKFVKLDGVGKEDATYRRTDLAKAAGVSSETVYWWIRNGVLMPSIRQSSRGQGMGPLYSWADLFCAAVIGMARRQGMPTSVLRQIQPLFSGDHRQKKKRSERKGSASARS